MKPEIKDKWLDALRSGKYKQTKNMLRNKNAYCCLGVLADIYSKEVGAEWKPDSAGCLRIENDNGILPYCIQSWAGLKQANPDVEIGGVHYSLAQLNDGREIRRKTFKQIASIIEKEL